MQIYQIFFLEGHYFLDTQYLYGAAGSELMKSELFKLWIKLLVLHIFYLQGAIESKLIKSELLELWSDSEISS